MQATMIALNVGSIRFIMYNSYNGVFHHESLLLLFKPALLEGIWLHSFHRQEQPFGRVLVQADEEFEYISLFTENISSKNEGRPMIQKDYFYSNAKLHYMVVIFPGVFCVGVDR